MSSSQIDAVRRAVEVLGSQAALARALGVTPVTVGQWLKPEVRTGRQVPPKQCIRIEQVTGKQVKRQDLRPADWHEIWPPEADLAVASAPPPPSHPMRRSTDRPEAH